MRVFVALVSLLAASFLTPGISAQPDVEVCSEPAGDILDLETLTDTIEVDADDAIIIGNVEVPIDISHTWIGDMDIVLTSPTATEVQLHDEGGGAADDMLLTFGDLGIENGSAAFTCDCLMQVSGPGDFLDFLEEDSEGEWSLDITDNAAGDPGTLNEWCLNFFEDPGVRPVEDLALASTDVEGEVEVSWTNAVDYDEVEVRSGDTVLETLESLLAGDPESVVVTLDVPRLPAEICVVPFVGDTEGGVACDTVILNTHGFFHDCAEPAVDLTVAGGEEISDINVDDGTVVVESVEAQVEVTTAWNGYTVGLASPEGTEVTLNTGFDGSDISLVFSQSGVPHGTIPRGSGGAMQPSGPGNLDDFYGEVAEGDWSLGITAVFEDGVFDKWCLDIIGCVVLPPTAFTCVEVAGNVEMEWINESTYGDIEIWFDGELLETIEGSDETYTHEDVAAGRHVYQLRALALSDECSIRSENCKIGVGIASFCVEETLDLVGNARAQLHPLEVTEALTIEGFFDVFVLLTETTTTGNHTVGLRSPSETLVMLHTGAGGNSGFDVFYDDDGLANAGVPGVLSGGNSVQPSGPGAMSDFHGESTAGTWDLILHSFEDASLDGFCLGIIPACDLSPPEDVTCTAEGQEVTLEWTNGDTYDGVEIVCNGLVVETLDGDEETYTRSALPGTYVYQVVGVDEKEGCRLSSEACIVEKGLIEVCLDEAVDIPMDGVPVATIVEVTDEVSVASTEAQVRIDANIASITLESPLGTTVTLAIADIDATISDDGTYPFLFGQGNYDCGGCKLPPFGPGTMGDFAGEAADGDWTVTTTANVGLDASMEEFCLRVFGECSLVGPTLTDCAGSEKSVDLEWLNEDVYDAIHIVRANFEVDGPVRNVARNGTVIAIIDGSDESYSDDTIVAGNHYAYAVVGYSDDSDCGAPSTSTCDQAIGRMDTCSVPDLEVPATGLLTEDTIELVSFGPGVIGEADVVLDITTGFTNWIITVTSPEGTEVELNGGATNAFPDIDVTYSDAGIPYFSGQPLDLDGGLLQPSGPGAMPDFNGEVSEGTWTLGMQAFTEGTLNEWCLGLFPPEDDGPTFIRGDVDGNGSVSFLLDSLFLLEANFLDGDDPPCLDAADADDDGVVSLLLDALYFLSAGFVTGEPDPLAPYPDCGTDPDGDDDGLSCDESTCTP